MFINELFLQSVFEFVVIYSKKKHLTHNFFFITSFFVVLSSLVMFLSLTLKFFRKNLRFFLFLFLNEIDFFLQSMLRVNVLNLNLTTNFCCSYF